MKKVTRLSIKPEPQIPTQTQTKAEDQQEATSQPKTSTSTACQRVRSGGSQRADAFVLPPPFWWAFGYLDEVTHREVGHHAHFEYQNRRQAQTFFWIERNRGYETGSSMSEFSMWPLVLNMCELIFNGKQSKRLTDPGGIIKNPTSSAKGAVYFSRLTLLPCSLREFTETFNLKDRRPSFQLPCREWHGQPLALRERASSFHDHDVRTRGSGRVSSMVGLQYLWALVPAGPFCWWSCCLVWSLTHGLVLGWCKEFGAKWEETAVLVLPRKSILPCTTFHLGKTKKIDYIQVHPVLFQHPGQFFP